MRVGVIGLGSMGMGAALSALRAGLAVTGCDPRAAARDEFIAAGGAAVAKASDLSDGLRPAWLSVV
jgi:3-hydroxyisobutyrate dehydrogenase-like beta-hydroxyacid dehydrogenase